MNTVRMSDTLTMDRIIHGHWRLMDWKMTREELLRFVEEVMDLGITTVDTADIYGGFSCEEAFGEALKIKKGLREKLTIVTKCGIVFPCENRPQYKTHHYDNSRKHILMSAERSLKNFGTDYLDLLLIHRPSPFMDPAEVSEAFRELYQSGKVRNFGVSNYNPSQFELLSSYVEYPLVTNQVEISPMNVDVFKDGTMDSIMTRGLYPMAWSPLAGGEIFTGSSDKAINVRNMLLSIGEKYEEDRIDTLAYAFLLSHPANILPIVGSGKIEHIRNALDALNINFSSEDWLSVYKASIGNNLP
ncbi:MAG TPA: aldo/keto reductase [Bacteroidales bacterium]|nr:aldo/keto reductase [Bacteroidales bacterium]